VDVRFRTARLRQCAESEVAAIREWGPIVGRRYADRIRLLQRTRRVQDLYGIRSLDFHPLTGNLSGSHAIRLTGRMRLIVVVHGAESLTIEAVLDYHG
jgi:plasmid maintenance system killer protein